MQTLRIIVPAYNEAGCIKPFYEAVEPYLKKEGIESTYLFVDDGSKDSTLDEIKELRKLDSRVNYISFSRNCGKEAAMYAGLKASSNQDMAIIIDADLQHPPYLIKDMLEKHEEGYKIVYTKQSSRANEGFFRRSWAKLFYGFFNKHADVPMEQSTKDFMLIDKDVIKAFLDMPDEYRFTKGILSFVGFKRYPLEFEYIDRTIGKSKWNFKKLLKYGVSGLNQFSDIFLVVPVVVSILSLLAAIGSIVIFCLNVITLGTFLILLCGSILFMLTNITLYFVLFVLYSTRRETLKRPLYFIEETSLDE